MQTGILGEAAAARDVCGKGSQAAQHPGEWQC